jgi:hypothetical protein
MAEKTIYERFYNLFLPRENTLGITTIPKKIELQEGSKLNVPSRTEITTPDEKHIESHLNGVISYGFSPILTDLTCKWACIDIDIYPFDLENISIKYYNMPFFFCKTKSNGVHLYLFFKKKHKAKKIRVFLRQLVYLLGLPKIFLDRGKAEKDIEVYPKQDKLLTSEKGNWLNLPYYDYTNTRRYCIRNGIKLSLDQFLEEAEKNLITDLDLIIDHFKLGGAPPCIQKMWARGDIADGNRDTALFSTATFLKKKFPHKWQEELKQFNSLIKPPLTDKELRDQIIKSNEKKDYFYKCKSDLMELCFKADCVYRKFGIASDDSPERVIGIVKKLMSKPPIWLVEIIGSDKIVSMSTEDFMNQQRFRIKVLEATNRIMPLVQKYIWEDILNDRLETLEEVEAAQDADVDATLYFLIEQFCLKNSDVRSLEDTIYGNKVYIGSEKAETNKGKKKVWYNFFKGLALVDYLKKKMATVQQPHIIYNKVREIGGDSIRKSYKGKKFYLWRLPLYPSQQIQIQRTKPDWKEYEKGLQEKGEF